MQPPHVLAYLVIHLLETLPGLGVACAFDKHPVCVEKLPNTCEKLLSRLFTHGGLRTNRVGLAKLVCKVCSYLIAA